MKSVPELRNHTHLPAGAFGRLDRPVARRRAQRPSEPEPEWRDLVYELAPLAYLNFDTQGRILDFNVAASRLLGASLKRDLHRPLADFFSPRHHRRFLNHIRQSQTSRVPVVTRLRLRERSDSAGATEVEVSTRPVSEALCYRTQLVPIAGSGSFAAWPADDAKFRALVENSNEVICIGSPDGTIFYTTPSVQRVLGYAPASWFGRNAFEIMRRDEAEAAREAVRKLAGSPTGSVIRLVTQVRHGDGAWRWVEAILTNLIGQPAVGGIVCNYRDITDSHGAQEALRSSEQRYRLLAESLPQMISVRDAEGHIEYCNSLWCEYRGLTGASSAAYDWKEGIPPEDIATLDPPPWEEGKPPWDTECRIRRASDGALRWHSYRVIPLPGEVSSPPRWLAIATDIHERKQAEQERERLLSQLERERSELAVQYAVVRVLSESSSLGGAAPNLLAALCYQLGWQAGAFWKTEKIGKPGTNGAAERSGRALSLVHIRQQPGLAPTGVLRRSRPSPLRKGESLAGRVWAKKQPLSFLRISPHRGAAHHRAAARLGLRSAFAFPILLSDEVQGVVELFTRESFRPGKRLLDIIVASVSIQIGLFIQRTNALDLLRQSEEALIQVNNALEHRVGARTAELHEANRELSAEIIERTRLEREIIRISEREQRRIGQDLHDGLCQELAAIAFMTRALANRLSKSDAHGTGDPRDKTTPPDETGRINDVARLLNDSVSRARDIARGLHPVEMDADGLMVALNDLARHTGQAIACSFQCDEPILMPESDVALNLYRIAQEAVNNAIKYSRAEHIIISLDRDGPALRLCISDDGRGIPARPARQGGKRGGMGLHIMRYRARTMGATLRIDERQPRGTKIICLLPRK